MRQARRAVAVIANICICWSGAWAASAPRQPTSKWVLEYGQDECLLNRAYGTDAKPLILIVRKLPMDGDLTISVLKPAGGQDLDFGKAKVTFGAGEPVKASFQAYNLEAKKMRYVTAGVEDGAALIPSAAATGVISIDAPDEVDESFSVPGLGDALQALDDCALDLGRAWGVPVDQQLRLKKSARAVRHDYLQSSDYPTKELHNDENGRSQVRLTIDETGKALDCVPLKSVRSPAFAATACRLLLNRAHFQPALDVAGKPMRSIYVYSISWIVAG